MNKKWIVPMALSAALVTTPLVSSGQAFAEKDVSFIHQELQKQKPHMKQLNVPVYVKGKELEKITTKDAKRFLSKNKQLLNIEQGNGQFKVKKTKKDKIGMKHVHMQQSVNGIPVEGSEMIVHYGTDGNVQSVNGYYNKELEETDLSTKPSISKDQALKTAKEKVSAPDVLPYKPTTELVIYPFQGENHVAYKTNVNFLGQDPGNWYVYVDAHSGVVIDKVNTLMDVGQLKASTGSGTGVLGQHRNLHISHKNIPGDNKGTMFFLNDISHENLEGILTYDLNNQWNAPFPGDLFSDTDAAFNEEYDRAAVDAHYNSEKVYHYYLEEHGRNSIDGEGMAIKSSVHYGQEYNNAFWNGQQMTYGDGDGEYFISLSAGLDVAAHEMTHGVTTHTAGLKYQFQSGALNESFSDIFGALIDEEDWELGEDIMADEAVASGRTSLRSLANPSKYMVGAIYTEYGDGSGTYPSHMDQYYDLPRSLDNGGVHINSSISNHAAYLIGTEIGKDKLGQIYYRALIHYLTPNSDFKDARHAVVQSAEDLYGEGSAEAQAAASGFDQVGIME
ncbi:flagellar biosynthesis protein FlgM [Virgibacillus phasianinus]|uniref:Neutral metalloproteinase n=1 Tax=Virgibacillus phasianinus TaxID=2017483 RepID=A0A220U6Q7_9BACI|nr:M4 family metallopeptidase [Virgibacillus phasianinus]ASK63780.1 flagellar biosynthesis protein FlgM [Virgibacillus phasianinus]